MSKCKECKCFTCAENSKKNNKWYPNRCIGCGYCFNNCDVSATESCATYKEKRK